MSWNNVLGLWLVGGFIVYLISAGRMNAYLALFSSTAVSYNAAPPTIQTASLLGSAAPTTTTPTAAAAAPNTATTVSAPIATAPIPQSSTGDLGFMERIGAVPAGSTAGVK